MEKFVSQDDWAGWQNNATEEEAKKAEQMSRTLIERYQGEVRIVSAQMRTNERASGDPDFFKFVVTIETPTGEVKDLVYFYSFKTFQYGPKKVLIFGVKLQQLFEALGFEKLSISSKNNAESVRVQQKYLGGRDAEGYLPRWVGLRFAVRIDYKTGSFHVKKLGEEFAVVNADDKVHIFPSVRAINLATNAYEERPNQPIVSATRDLVKAIAGQCGVQLTYPEVLRIGPVAGANTELLAAFEPQKVKVQPVHALDAHSLVTEVATADESDTF